MDIQKHLERAQEAVRKKNYDYAIALFNQVLAVKPDNGQARAALRQALSKRSDYRGGGNFISKALSLPQLLLVYLSKMTGGKDGTIRACERYLLNDPHNVSINSLLGRSLEEAGHLHSAAAVYEFLGEVDKNNTEALKSAGMIRYRNKDIPGALELYERVLAINPRDAEAEKMRKNLAAEGTLASGSYTTAKSSHELIKEKDEAAHLQRQTRIHKTGDEIEQDIAHIKKNLEENPEDRRLMKELGDLYLKKKDFSTALAHFEGMLEKDPDSFDLKCTLGDIEIKTYQEEIHKLETRLAKEANDNLKEDLKSLKQELLAKQVDEYGWRVKAHPTDLGLWFEYGQYVFRMRKVDEAIEAFQNSVKDPRHRVISLHMLGRSFMLKGLFDLAEKQLEGALDAVGGVLDKSKSIVYDLGQVAERKGDTQTATDWYLKILEIDINYKDVTKKIDQLKQS